MIVKDQWLRDHWKRMDAYITDFLCCTPETNVTLSINYAPIKINKHFLKKLRKRKLKDQQIK